MFDIFSLLLRETKDIKNEEKNFYRLCMYVVGGIVDGTGC